MNTRRISALFVALGLLGLLFLAERTSQADGWIVRSEAIPDEVLRCECQENLRQIEKATRQWMFDNRRRLDAVPQWSDLVGVDKYLASQPACPAGGDYTLAGGGSLPACSLAATHPANHVYTANACDLSVAAQEMACRDNLEAIQRAKLKWAFDQRLPLAGNGTEPTWDDLVGPGKYLKQIPACPSGGTYSIGALDLQYPSCSREDSGAATHSILDPRVAGDALHACQENQRRIEDAKRLFVSHTNAPTTSTVTMENLVGVTAYLPVAPVCPSGGVYTVGDGESLVSCSLAGVPGFVHVYDDSPGGEDTPSRRGGCQENQARMWSSTLRWAMDTREPATAIPSWDDLVGESRYLRAMPVCPSGGEYTTMDLGSSELLFCSLAGSDPHLHAFSTERRLDAAHSCEHDRRAQCRQNLRLIEDAKAHLGRELGLASDAEPTWEQLVGEFAYLHATPACPSGGVYTVGTVAELASCSLGPDALHAHTYDENRAPEAGLTFNDVHRVEICRANLVRIDEAVRRWQSDNGQPETAVPTWNDLLAGSTVYLRSNPSCPSGGIYTLKAESESASGDFFVECSLGGEAQFPHTTGTGKAYVAEVFALHGERGRIGLCAENLRAIDSAKEQWAREQGKSPGAVPAWSDLVGPGKYLRRTPVCPSDGVYTLRAVNQPARCSGGPGHLAATSEGRYHASEFMDHPNLGERAWLLDGRDECVANLRALDRVKQQWLLDVQYPGTATPDWSDLMVPAKYLRTSPACPNNGTYSMNSTDHLPDCSLGFAQVAPIPVHAVPIPVLDEAGRCTCQENLRKIRDASVQWRLDNSLPDDYPPQWSDLVGPGLYLGAIPVCPGGGVYTLIDESGKPWCTRATVPGYLHEFSEAPCETR